MENLNYAASGEVQGLPESLRKGTQLNFGTDIDQATKVIEELLLGEAPLVEPRFM